MFDSARHLLLQHKNIPSASIQITTFGTFPSSEWRHMANARYYGR